MQHWEHHRSALTAAWRGMSRSNLFLVALAPPTVDQIIDASPDAWQPWGWLVALLLLAFFVYVRLALIDARRRRAVTVVGDLTPEEADRVVVLVATRNARHEELSALVHALPVLPRLRHIVLVSSDPGAAVRSVGELQASLDRRWVERMPEDRPPRLEPDVLTLDAFSVRREEVESVAAHLLAWRTRYPGEGRVVVDVTNGTTPMSLAAVAAATQADVTAVYCVVERRTDRYQGHNIVLRPSPADHVA